MVEIGFPLDSAELRELLLAPAGPVSKLEVVSATGSTNTDLMAALRDDPSAWPHGSILIADHQQAGRGRGGRDWQTPPQTALTFSLVLKFEQNSAVLPALPALIGLGALQAIRATAGLPAELKWPNDIVLPAPGEEPVPGWGIWRKVGGVLIEVLPGGAGAAKAAGAGTRGASHAGAGPIAVVGLGINVHQEAHELPVPHATSLRHAGARGVGRKLLLVALAQALLNISDQLSAAGGDLAASDLLEQVASHSVLMGQALEVKLPGGKVLRGIGTGLGASGELLVTDAAGETHTISSADVELIRTLDSHPGL